MSSNKKIHFLIIYLLQSINRFKRRLGVESSSTLD